MVWKFSQTLPPEEIFEFQAPVRCTVHTLQHSAVPCRTGAFSVLFTS